MRSRAFDSGVAMVCAERKVSLHDAVRMFSKQAALAESPVMTDALLKIGATIFRAAGDNENAQMYELMRQRPLLTKYARAVYVEPVLEVLGRCSYREAEEFEKRANPAIAAFTKATGVMPDLLQTIAVISAGMGAGGGALWWALNRDTEANDLEVQAKEEQAKYYRDLAKEIQRKAKLKAQKVVRKEPDVVNKPTENLLPANDDFYA